MSSSVGSKLKIMAVVCHPADAIDGAGGTLSLHVQKGDDVAVVVCTHGVDTHDLQRSDTIRFSRKAKVASVKTAIENKENEVRKGLKILGVTDVRFLRFEDSLLLADRTLIEAVAQQLAEFQPHILITHNPQEQLGIADIGHAQSAIASLKARTLANGKKFLKKQCDREFPMQIFFMEMNGETTLLTALGRRWGNVLIDITSVIQKKVEALECINSQYYSGHLARKCLEDTNGEMGKNWCVPYAEAFEALNPHIYDHLPANEYLKKLYETKTGDRYTNMRIML
jgi:LmbE family N-acetylglucosaminyl deacetylase